MSQYSLENFGAYQKARQLFDLVVQDIADLKNDPLCYRLVALAVDIIEHRIALADEIIAILTKTMDTLRRDLQKSSGSVSYLKDETPTDDMHEDVFPSSLDPRP